MIHQHHQIHINHHIHKNHQIFQNCQNCQICKKIFQTKFKATIWELKDDGDTTDVTLAFDDQRIKAHKMILSAYSLWINNFGKCLYQSKKELKGTSGKVWYRPPWDSTKPLSRQLVAFLCMCYSVQSFVLCALIWSWHWVQICTTHCGRHSCPVLSTFDWGHNHGWEVFLMIYTVCIWRLKEHKRNVVWGMTVKTDIE